MHRSLAGAHAFGAFPRKSASGSANNSGSVSRLVAGRSCPREIHMRRTVFQEPLLRFPSSREIRGSPPPLPYLSPYRSSYCMPVAPRHHARSSSTRQSPPASTSLSTNFCWTLPQPTSQRKMRSSGHVALGMRALSSGKALRKGSLCARSGKSSTCMRCTRIRQMSPYPSPYRVPYRTNACAAASRFARPAAPPSLPFSLPFSLV